MSRVEIFRESLRKSLALERNVTAALLLGAIRNGKDGEIPRNVYG